MKSLLALALACGGALAGSVARADTSSRGEQAGADGMGRHVQELLRAHQTDVFGCVRAAPRAVEGELLVRVVVGEGGQAARVEALKRSGYTADDCLLEKMAHWNYTPLGAAVGDQVVFPLAFKPGGVRASLARVPRWSPELFAAPDDADRAYYVLDGQLPVKGGQRLQRGDVLFVPRGVAPPIAPGERPAASDLVAVVAAAPPRRTALAWRLVRAEEAKPHVIASGKGTARLYLDGTGAAMAVDALTVQAGVVIPPHRHPDSDELIYVIRGRGVTTVDGRKVPTTPGAIVEIPAGAEHSLVVDEALTAVQVYAPAGPEQRFKQAPPK